MILTLLALLTIGIAYTYAKFPEKFDPTVVEIVRWLIVIVAWFNLGSVLDGIAAFLIAQALYTPAYNYFSGKDVWFIDNDTWLGKQIIKYLGEGSGKVWFWVQLGVAIVLIIL